MRSLVWNLLDCLIGWRGAVPATRARLLESFCLGIRLRSLISNAMAAVIVIGLILAETRQPLHAIWLVAVIVGGLLPRLYAIHLLRDGRFDRAPQRKALGFIVASAVYGVIWGAGPFLLLPSASSEAIGILLMVMVFGTIMGPYAAMPGILYARLASTGGLTLIAIALYTTPRLTVVALIVTLWLVVRTDIWRGYHRALRHQIELGQALEMRNAELRHVTRAQDRANERLKVLAETDSLTGVANRRQFMSRLDSLDAPAALILLDVDNFKSINDSFGHLAGDAVLRDVAGRVQHNLRKHDLLARIGGDEFAVLLPETSLDQANHVAARIRETMTIEGAQPDGGPIAATVSLGVAASPADVAWPDGAALFHAADAAMYADKHRGRNRFHTDIGQQTSVGA